MKKTKSEQQAQDSEKLAKKDIYLKETSDKILFPKKTKNS